LALARRRSDVMNPSLVLIAALAAVVCSRASAQGAAGTLGADSAPLSLAGAAPAPLPLPFWATASTFQRLFANGGVLALAGGAHRGGSANAGGPAYLRDASDPLDRLLDVPRSLVGGGAPAVPAGGTDGKLAAPYYAMVHDARQASLSMALGAQRRLRLALLYEGAFGTEVLPTMTPYAKRSLVSAEIEQRMGRAVGVFSLGMLRESGSVLGGAQGSALAFNAAARTSFASFSLGYALTPRLSLVGMGSAGRTAGFRNADSPATQLSAVSTVAYSVGLAGRQLFDSRDRFGLTVTVPTKVTEGALSLAGALVQREDGALSYVNRTLNLAPSATERDIEMSYARPLTGTAKLSAALMLRVNPGHDAGSPHELLLGLRYGRKF
jgi:hypothetical protein